MKGKGIIVECPNCNQPVNVTGLSESATCPTCTHQFPLNSHFCPDCFSFYEDETAVCIQCSAAINLVCHRCDTSNWAGNEICRNCGAELDIFEMIHDHTKQGERERLQKMMREANQIKAAELKAADQRMAVLMEIEQERQIELARRQAIQKRKETIMLTLGIGIAVLFLLALVGWALLQ